MSSLAAIVRLAALLTLFLLTGLGHEPEFAMQDNERRAKLEAGRNELENINRRAKGNECWQSAVARLNGDCRNLDEVDKSRLAVAFTNCHLAMSDRVTYPCPDEKIFADCTRPMSETAFQAYTTFRAHTDNICFYLQSQLWQERTENTINRLTTTSREVAKGMSATLNQSQQLLQGQEESLANQKQILRNEQSLKRSLSDARQGVEQILNSTEEQRQEFTKFFDQMVPAVMHVNSWMATLVGEYLTARTIFFYAVVFAISYFLTTSNGTISARLPVLLVWVVCIMLERFFIWWATSDSQRQPDMNVMYTSQSVLRGLAGMVAFLFLTIAWWQYCDQTEATNKKLTELQKTVDDILKRVKGHEGMSPPVTPSNPGFNSSSQQLQQQMTATPSRETLPLSHASPIPSSWTDGNQRQQLISIPTGPAFPSARRTPWPFDEDEPDFPDSQQNISRDSGINASITVSPESAASPMMDTANNQSSAPVVSVEKDRTKTTNMETPVKQRIRRKANQSDKPSTPGHTPHRRYNLRSRTSTPVLVTPQ